jgi:hypothetical protein
LREKSCPKTPKSFGFGLYPKPIHHRNRLQV